MLWRGMFALAAPGGRRARLAILIFHRVRSQVDPLFPGEPDAAQFAALLRHLSTRFRVLPLGEGIDRLYDGTLPSRALAITFDDGYADNFTVAAPLLQAAGMPATIFVAAGHLDGGAMWNDRVIEAVRGVKASRLDLAPLGLGVLDTGSIDAKRGSIDRLLFALKYRPQDERERDARTLQDAAQVADPIALMMTSAQVEALARHGIAVGAHTLTHPILTRLADVDARVEIAGSKARLEAITGRPVKLFAYPNGRPQEDYGPAHVRMVREAGFAAAVSTAWGAATAACDRFQLPRFTPWTRRPLRFDLLMLRNLRAAASDRVAV